MRKRKRVQNKDGEMPLSAMIDVVFLLLIYFIVTQVPILEETLLEAELPNGPSVAVPGTPFVIDVFEEKGDFYRVEGTPLRKKALFAYLKTIGRNDPDLTIVINCGSNAEHEKRIHLLDACADAKLTKLNIVNDESRPLKK